uniref:Uncharacterized protein n=1 Tax=Rhizophora mucronata TaxID=61149 RepID=A0A2P2PEZ9_RHIMU
MYCSSELYKTNDAQNITRT